MVVLVLLLYGVVLVCDDVVLWCGVMCVTCLCWWGVLVLCWCCFVYVCVCVCVVYVVYVLV